jgi:hypothetical protein
MGQLEQIENKLNLQKLTGHQLLLGFALVLIVFIAQSFLVKVFADNTASGWEFSTPNASGASNSQTDPFGTAAAGVPGSELNSNPTGQGPNAMTPQQTPDWTSHQQTGRNDIPFAGAPTTTTPTLFTQLDKIYGRTLPSALPATRLDSFVKQAGGQAEQIYGDEGVIGIPPMFGSFGTINSGIHSGGLTTGNHYPGLPGAW